MKTRTGIAIVALAASAMAASGAIFIDADQKAAGPMGYIGDGLNAGIFGDVYDTTLFAWQDFIDTNAPLSNFHAMTLDYPNGLVDTIAMPNTIGEFLGADAATLTDPTAASLQMDTKLFHFTGYLEVGQGMATIGVGSDDGFALRIGDNFISDDLTGDRPFTVTDLDVDFEAAGLYEFELFYYANDIDFSGLEVSAGGDIIPTGALYTVIPAPASLGVIALGGIAAIRRRR